MKRHSGLVSAHLPAARAATLVPARVVLMTRHGTKLAALVAVALAACRGVPLRPGEAELLRLSGDQVVTLPSGATLRMAKSWTAASLQDGATLEDPEHQLRVELVEVEAGQGLPASIAAAWERRRPGFARSLTSSEEVPGREGWDQRRWAFYQTSPQENRTVQAFAWRKGALAVVWLLDAPRAAAQRRNSQLSIMADSVRAGGFAREWYAGRRPRPLDATRLAELRQFIERMREAADIPGVAVALFDREKTILEAGFGVRERGRPEPVTPDTLFLIASNTQPLTTLLLAKLVEEGRIGWDTPVTQFFPMFRLADPQVTRRVLVRHLICACTGLPRQDLEWLFTFEHTSPRETLDILATMKPTTDFGELFQYSNVMASAAGYAAAHVLRPGGEPGQAYDQAMRDEVFRPLGMTATTFAFDDVLRAEHASPHSWDLALKSVPVEFRLNHAVIPVRPAGGAWSTVRDYARYVRLELTEGRLPDGTGYLSAKNLLARREPQVRTGEETWYGMGLWIEVVKGIYVISHGGSLRGYKSNWFAVPELGLGGVVFTNADMGWDFTSAFHRRVLELVYDGKPEAEEDLRSAIRETYTWLRGQQKDWVVPPDPAAVGQLASAYHSTVLGDLRVERSGQDVVFGFGGWKSRVATKRNPDGTVSFVTVDPGVRGNEFNVPASQTKRRQLVIRDPQHVYAFDAVE